MAKIGDAVTINILGAPGTGTALGYNTGRTSITVAPGEKMALQGEIIRDEGGHWVVKLNVSIGGTNTISVSKEAEEARG